MSLLSGLGAAVTRTPTVSETATASESTAVSGTNAVARLGDAVTQTPTVSETATASESTAVSGTDAVSRLGDAVTLSLDTVSAPEIMVSSIGVEQLPTVSGPDIILFNDSDMLRLCESMSNYLNRYFSGAAAPVAGALASEGSCYAVGNLQLTQNNLALGVDEFSEARCTGMLCEPILPLTALMQATSQEGSCLLAEELLNTDSKVTSEACHNSQHVLCSDIETLSPAHIYHTPVADIACTPKAAAESDLSSSPVSKKKRTRERKKPTGMTMRQRTQRVIKTPRQTRKVKVPNSDRRPKDFAVVLPSGSEDSLLSNSDMEEDLIPKSRHNEEHDRISTEPIAATDEVRSRQKFCWKDENVKTTPRDVPFTGTFRLDEFDDLQTPLQFFRHFCCSELIDNIAEQTMLYSAQQRPHSPIKATRSNVEKFVGVALYMSLVRMPSTRNYFSAQFRIPQIAETMTGKRFEEIKRFIHFSDHSSPPNGDKLRKLRPLLDKLRNKFVSIPMCESLSVDEQIVPFKGTSHLKQYIPMKPHKWGYKVYVLCGSNGFAYDFEVYSGKQETPVLENETNGGFRGNIVIRLARSVPSHVNHKLYFDNYFNSPKLQIFLAKRGIYSLGTVRRNRLPNCKLLADKELKKRGRGSHVEKVATANGVTFRSLRASVCYISFARGNRSSGVARWRHQLITHGGCGSCGVEVHCEMKCDEFGIPMKILQFSQRTTGKRT